MSNLLGEDLKTTEKTDLRRKKYFKVGNTLFSATNYVILTEVIRLVDPRIWDSSVPSPIGLKIIQLDMSSRRVYTFPEDAPDDISDIIPIRIIWISRSRPYNIYISSFLNILIIHIIK